MSDLTHAPVTDPVALYTVRDSLFAPDMLIAAVSGLDFFTWLDAHPCGIDDIARHFGFHRRPVDVMTTLFVSMGLLERATSILQTTELAREHLVSSSPWYLGPYYPKVADRPIARDLLEVLRTGQPARFLGREDEDDWHRAMESEAVAEEFTAAMDLRGALTAQALAKHVDLAGHERLLDIAGGSGVFACALVQRFPGLQASVLERAPVDAIARRSIARRGCAERVQVITGDMLESGLPAGYDVHLFSNVLHDWGEDIVRQLLRASADSLPEGGIIVIHEAFLNARKTGPLAVAEYSVLLMHFCQGRCYAASELEAWLSEIGFSSQGVVPTALGRSALTAVKVA